VFVTCLRLDTVHIHYRLVLSCYDWHRHVSSFVILILYQTYIILQYLKLLLRTEPKYVRQASLYDIKGHIIVFVVNHSAMKLHTIANQ
jgi:hypothetical protein